MYQPDCAVFVVADEFKILGFAHIASPYNLGIVDVRGVVDPFIKGIVLGRVSDDRELSSWYLLQAGLNLRS